ncbi:MAG: hypothetical protein AAGB24_12850 [Bacteroidota bacterium]
MKPTDYVLLIAVLLLGACATVPRLQSVASHIPCIGAIGEDRSALFKKEFVKVGEPILTVPIGVTLNSYAFDKASYTKYAKYAQKLGKKPMVAYNDTIRPGPRYYTLKISDLVSLRSQLNHEQNGNLLTYMATDKDLRILNEISFVVAADVQEVMVAARHYDISGSKQGLVLEAHGPMGRYTLGMAELQVFDFGTAGICWTKNRFGTHQIAAFLTDGRSCPGDTERDPQKLNEINAYLKF